MALQQALARRAAAGVRAEPPSSRVLGRGDGWSVDDVICTSGPHDRPFEERHSWTQIAIVTVGTFQYRSSIGHDVMTPGSLLLGNAGQSYECRHDHGEGDRCISFGYSAEYFEKLATAPGGRPRFQPIRIPPLRPLSVLVARACAGVT